MSKKLYLFVFIIVFGLLPAINYAFFCPTNFAQINAGDSMAQVIAACGKPNQQTTKEVKPQGPQVWNYFVTQTVSNNGLTPLQGTLKMQITFDETGKAININVNGIGVGGTGICGGHNVSLQNTLEQVKSACGAPAFINQESPGTGAESTEETSFTYQSNPPVTLIFKNGVLQEQQ